jgi:hypothetical protein|tara:strand:+ start:326 stop:496 length:171 start_codon:yes stop_codon:yes gene_type:complete
MEITSAKYGKNLFGTVILIKAVINGIEWQVPLDEANTDYQTILKWVEEGNTIEEAD